jgi:hypothetical protein
MQTIQVVITCFEAGGHKGLLTKHVVVKWASGYKMGIIWLVKVPPQAAIAEVATSICFCTESRKSPMALNFCYSCFLLVFMCLCLVLEHRMITAEFRLHLPSHGEVGLISGCIGFVSFGYFVCFGPQPEKIVRILVTHASDPLRFDREHGGFWLVLSW